MKKITFILAFLCSILSFAQEQREDGTWYDGELAFKVVDEDLEKEGTMLICIYKTSNNRCIHNLITPFEVIIYNEDNEQIWNSAWTGTNTDLKFRQPLPGAKYVVIRAKNDYVVNTMSGKRIFTDGQMELEYVIE